MIKQTPWIERQFEFSFPIGLFPVIVERLRGISPRIKNMIENIPDELLSQKISEAWSIKEQVGHLCDLEELWYGRVEDFLGSLDKLRAADMSNAKTSAAGHNSKNIEELMAEFAASRNKLVESVEAFDEQTASRTSVHPRLQTPMRLVDLLFFVAEHDDHHLAKMRSIIELQDLRRVF